MYYNNETLVFLDGNFVKEAEARTGLYGQAMHYGNAIFEGMRAYETEDGARIFKVREHFERFHFSAKTMHIALPYSVEEMELFCYRLLEKNNFKDAYLRPLLFTGANMTLVSSSESHLVIMAWPWGKYLGDKMLNVMLSSYQRPNPKSCHVEAKVAGHYINSILATTEAKSKGYDEALLLDMNGYVAEAPGANFFYEKNGRLFTPPKGNILPGITRATVFEIARELGIEVNEKLFTPEEVMEADAAFFCGTAVEVSGIGLFNDRPFPLKWEDSASYYIQKKYKRRTAHNEYTHLYL